MLPLCSLARAMPYRGGRYGSSCTAALLVIVFGGASVLAGPLQAQERPDSVGAPASLVVHADVDPFIVIVDEDYKGARWATSGDTLPLPSGWHTVTLANRVSFDNTVFRHFEPGSVVDHTVRFSRIRSRTREYLRTSSYPVLASGGRLLVYTDPDVEALLDGRSLGTGTRLVDTLDGTYTLLTRHPKLGVRSARVTLGSRAPRLQVVSLYHRPRAATARALAILPGVSQFYQRERTKGFAFVAACASGLALVAWSQQDYQRTLDRFDASQEAYWKATEEEEALLLGDEAEAARAAVVEAQHRRTRFLAAALILYAGNIVDAWIGRPAVGFRGRTRRIDVRVAPVPQPAGTGVGLQWRW